MRTINPVIYYLTPQGKKCAEEISQYFAASTLLGKNSGDGSSTISELKHAYLSGQPIIGICAIGILVRLLGNLTNDKWQDAPILAIDEKASMIIPVLGSHHGGRDIARHIADNTGATIYSTSASDEKFKFSLDDLPDPWIAETPSKWKEIAQRLFEGEQIREKSGTNFLKDAGYPVEKSGTINIAITSSLVDSHDADYTIRPRNIYIGIGCERGTPAGEIEELFLKTLKQNDISVLSVRAIGSINLKADEFGITALAKKYALPYHIFTNIELEAEKERLVTPSEIVFKEVGCHGVAEGAALALSGKESILIQPKTKSRRVTCAIAKIPESEFMNELPGKARGILRLVSIGPGKDDWRTPEATSHLLKADTIIGYDLYLDIVSHIIKDKEQITYPLGDEEVRVRDALNIAGTGKDVALVSSGDAGIYAMGALLHELLDTGRGLTPDALRVEVLMSPGITAMQGAAARIGSVLGHDFCAISLSDLLTPLETIHKRVNAAAIGDFVIAFYNPVSKRRRTQLGDAKQVLLQHRSDDTPVILGRNLGRDTEKLTIVNLVDLNIDDVDMLTTVIVGASNSKSYIRGDGQQYVYTPRGYDKKEVS